MPTKDRSPRERRRMDMLTTEGRRIVTPRSSGEASLIGRHANAVRAVLHGVPGAERRLRGFAGKHAGGFEFETDSGVVVAEGLRGALSLDDIYPDEGGAA